MLQLVSEPRASMAREALLQEILARELELLEKLDKMVHEWKDLQTRLSKAWGANEEELDGGKKPKLTMANAKEAEYVDEHHIGMEVAMNNPANVEGTFTGKADLKMEDDEGGGINCNQNTDTNVDGTIDGDRQRCIADVSFKNHTLVATILMSWKVTTICTVKQAVSRPKHLSYGSIVYSYALSKVRILYSNDYIFCLSSNSLQAQNDRLGTIAFRFNSGYLLQEKASLNLEDPSFSKNVTVASLTTNFPRKHFFALSHARQFLPTFNHLIAYDFCFSRSLIFSIFPFTTLLILLYGSLCTSWGKEGPILLWDMAKVNGLCSFDGKKNDVKLIFEQPSTFMVVLILADATSNSVLQYWSMKETMMTCIKREFYLKEDPTHWFIPVKNLRGLLDIRIETVREVTRKALNDDGDLHRIRDLNGLYSFDGKKNDVKLIFKQPSTFMVVLILADATSNSVLQYWSMKETMMTCIKREFHSKEDPTHWFIPVKNLRGLLDIRIETVRGVTRKALNDDGDLHRIRDLNGMVRGLAFGAMSVELGGMTVIGSARGDLVSVKDIGVDMDEAKNVVHELSVGPECFIYILSFAGEKSAHIFLGHDMVLFVVIGLHCNLKIGLWVQLLDKSKLSLPCGLSATSILCWMMMGQLVKRIDMMLYVFYPEPYKDLKVVGPYIPMCCLIKLVKAQSIIKLG